MDRTSSRHVIDTSKWTYGELKLDQIPKFVASPEFHPDLNIPDDADEHFFTSYLQLMIRFLVLMQN